MNAGKKIFYIVIIMGATIVSYFFIFALMPLFRDTASIAATAPSAGNFSTFQSAMISAPWWFLVIPGAVALIASIMIMRQRESVT